MYCQQGPEKTPPSKTYVIGISMTPTSTCFEKIIMYPAVVAAEDEDDGALKRKQELVRYVPAASQSKQS